MFTRLKINRFQKKLQVLEDSVVNAKSKKDYTTLMNTHMKLITLCSEARVLREKNPDNKRARALFERSLEATEEAAIAIWH